MKQFLRALYDEFCAVKSDNYILSNDKFLARRYEAEIMRNVHSIEKGLSIEKPRLGFGIKKINEMFDFAERLLSLGFDDVTPMLAVGATEAYLAYHKSLGFENADIVAVSKRCTALKGRLNKDEYFGGTIKFTEEPADIEEAERLFITRHSVREFSGEPVPPQLIEKAVKLAQRAPSACNRQAVRVYNVSKRTFLSDIDSLSGIGGFAEGVDRFLVITGVKSAYRWNERNQFIVTAGIFAGFLALALHAYGVSSCVIQRSLVVSAKVRRFMKNHDIPEDEQFVVMIGIGMPKKQCNVPVSYRYPLSKIYKKID